MMGGIPLLWFVAAFIGAKLISLLMHSLFPAPKELSREDSELAKLADSYERDEISMLQLEQGTERILRGALPIRPELQNKRPGKWVGSNMSGSFVYDDEVPYWRNNV